MNMSKVKRDMTVFSVQIGNGAAVGIGTGTLVDPVTGGAGEEDTIGWDGTAGKGLVAVADAASLTPLSTFIPGAPTSPENYGAEYQSANAAGDAAGSWNVTIPANYTGPLTLEAYFKVDSTYRGDVTYTVDGAQGITVSQKPQGSESTGNWYWRAIGSFTFSGGTRIVTVAKAAGNTRRLWVGAIRLKGTLKGGSSGGGIVWDGTSGQFDDQTGPFSTPEGTWTADSVTTGAVGGSARRTESGTAAAVWTVTVPPGCTGTLQLEANIRKGPTGSTAAVYKIHGCDADTGDGQTATISMNSATDQSYGWITVGSFQFEGGM